ncbi:MAG TPA: hypothetical protein VFS02_03750 [Telluria sp.]|nr:hypothetical protein [Telluria sp.]
MSRFDLRPVCAIALLSLLTACGGSAGADPEIAAASSAALEVHSPAPVADCEADGCNRPRVIDGLAEQYRASAIAQPADPAAQAPAASAAAPAAPG